jgi:hypothetical protein
VAVVRRDLEAKLGGPRKLEAALSAARSSSGRESNISALAAALRPASPPVFHSAGDSNRSHRRRRPSVFAKAITDDANIVNKSLVDEQTPLVVKRGPTAAKEKRIVGQVNNNVSYDGKSSNRRNLIQEEKVETKAVGFKVKYLTCIFHIFGQQCQQTTMLKSFKCNSLKFISKIVVLVFSDAHDQIRAALISKICVLILLTDYFCKKIR